MSRQVKFKARVTSLIQVGEGGSNRVIAPGEWITYTPETFPIMWRDKIDLQTRRECTGLIDKNGTEIYEGDILEGLPQGAVKGWVEVVWLSDLSGFKLRHGLAHWDLYRDRAKDLEVIGNIYENPELLECS